MEWLNPIKDGLIVMWLAEFVINWSYYKSARFSDMGQESHRHFKSAVHQGFHYLVAVATAIVAVLIVIKWIFF